jgi:hypothetical protein
MAIIGAHALLYSHDAAEARRVLGDILGGRSVDAGGGWIIRALPPAEVGVHPTENPGRTVEPHHELSLLCDDIGATVEQLRGIDGVEVRGEPEDHGYGIVVMLGLPGGLEVQLYEPRHPTAL